MRRFLSGLLVAALLISSIPNAAMAQVVRAVFEINPLGPALGLSAASPTPFLNTTLSAGSPSLSLSVPILPAPSVTPASGVIVMPQAAHQAVKAVPSARGVQPVKPSLPGMLQAAPALMTPSASALFDGVGVHSTPSSGDPIIPEESSQVRIPRRRDIPQPFTSRLARWTGAAALYSVYRDGILVQRYAARLSDPNLSPARRTTAARMLASLGRLEAVPTLGWAHENDPSPRVRRAALAGMLRIALAAEPKLIRTLKTNPFSGAREGAATMLSWIVRYSDSIHAVEVLAAAGMMDVSEDTRLAAIRALTQARSPKAWSALEWMRARETRPRMRSALELALGGARRRPAGAAFHQSRESEDDLEDTRGPLHAVALKRALAVASVFVVIEMIGGYLTGNVALKADAMHLGADQLINAATLFSIWMARRPPNSRKTYGYLKVESVVALLGSVVIGFMGLEMGLEAWHHLFTPGAAATWNVALFALASLAANAFSAIILWRHQGESLSMKGVFLHYMTDAIGSLGVIVSVAAAILFGWAWVEPVAVALIVALILKTAWGLGKPAWDMLIDAVPAGIDLDRVEADLLALSGAAGVKDLHIWALNSQMTALTAVVLIRPGTDHDQILASAKALLRERHGIRHITVQIETISGATL